MDFGRVLTAMVTPFNDDLSVNYEEAQKLADYLVNNGSDGLVVCGTTGESPTLTKDEKLKLFKVVREAVGNKAKIIAGTGSNNTAETLELTKEAAKLDIDGVMLVAPYYNKPPQEGLYQHFKTVAEAIDKPIILYNVPGRTASEIQPATVARLAEIKNIACIKEASGKLDNVTEIRRLTSPDFTIYSGDDSLTLPMLTLGAKGIISVTSHIIGNAVQEMVTAYEEKNLAKATEIHLKTFPIYKAMFFVSNPIPVKAAMNLKGFKVGGLRPPLLAANEQEIAIIKKAMEDMGLL